MLRSTQPVMILDPAAYNRHNGYFASISLYYNLTPTTLSKMSSATDIQSLPSEVLRSIFFFVRNEKNGQRSIKECRLVSHCFNNAASPLLLTQVSVCLTSESFDRLEHICNHPIFSKSVQSVRIVTSYYEAELACNRPLFMLEAKARLLRHVETMERSRSYRNKYPHTQEQSRWHANGARGRGRGQGRHRG